MTEPTHSGITYNTARATYSEVAVLAYIDGDGELVMETFSEDEDSLLNRVDELKRLKAKYAFHTVAFE